MQYKCIFLKVKNIQTVLLATVFLKDLHGLPRPIAPFLASSHHNTSLGIQMEMSSLVHPRFQKLRVSRKVSIRYSYLPLATHLPSHSFSISFETVGLMIRTVCTSQALPELGGSPVSFSTSGFKCHNGQ